MKTTRNRPTPPQRKNRGIWTPPTACLGCSEVCTLSEKLIPSTPLIRGEEVQCEVPKWHCSNCGAVFMSPEQATEEVRTAVSAYQLKHHLLTAAMIRDGRKLLGMRPSDLAQKANIGEATVKRLEAGATVQTSATNALLEIALKQKEEVSIYYIVISGSHSSNHCSATPAQWKDEARWNRMNPWGEPSSGSYRRVTHSNKPAFV
ncbi:MAG: hypothetical protein EOP06_19145 [Proteobacteria bacterium]|nr:MAG: hypothetical protein EOP06_19145 [Pseudomonadota bacterium]